MTLTLNKYYKKITIAKASKSPAKKSSDNRELINTGTDKRFTKRNPDGTFKESDDVGKSLSKDVKTTREKGSESRIR